MHLHHLVVTAAMRLRKSDFLDVWGQCVVSL